MSPRYSQSAGAPRPTDGQPGVDQPAEEDGRPFTTGIGSMVGPADDAAEADSTRPGTSAVGDRTRGRPLPTAAGLDEPLFGDADALRTRWQRVQAGFVDDPREAVDEAADLIEQTAQAMIGALRQRQRQLRVMWESGPASEPGGPGEGASAARGGQDTEHLRLMMRHYRALFNQLCGP